MQRSKRRDANHRTLIPPNDGYGNESGNYNNYPKNSTTSTPVLSKVTAASLTRETKSNRRAIISSGASASASASAVVRKPWMLFFFKVVAFILICIVVSYNIYYVRYYGDSTNMKRLNRGGTTTNTSFEFQKLMSIFKKENRSEGTSNRSNDNNNNEKGRRRKILVEKKYNDGQTSMFVFEKIYQRARSNLEKCSKDMDTNMDEIKNEDDRKKNSNSRNDLSFFGVIQDLEQLSQVTAKRRASSLTTDDINNKTATLPPQTRNNNSERTYKFTQNINEYYSRCTIPNNNHSRSAPVSISTSIKSPCEINRNTIQNEVNMEGEGYAVIISFTPSSRHAASRTGANLSIFRTIFINILYLLSYKHVKTIVILYRDSGQTSIDDLKQDAYYGKRIWEWHLNNVHPVKIVTEKDIEGMYGYQHQQDNNDGDNRDDENGNKNDASDITKEAKELFHHVLFPFHPMLSQYFDQEIVLFLDHDDNNNYGKNDGATSSFSSNTNQLLIQDDGNTGGEDSFIIGYELSKSNNAALVGREEFIIYNHHQNSTPNRGTQGSINDQSNSMSFVRQCSTEGSDVRSSSSAADTNVNSTRGIGKGEGMRHTNYDTSSIMSSSGIFISKSNFCFIWHPIFESFRTFVQEKYIQVGEGSDSSTTTKSSQKFSDSTNATNSSTSSRITSLQHSHLIQSVAISTLMTQLSSQMPLLYPLIQNGQNNQEEEHQSNKFSGKGRRLFAEEDHHNVHYRRRRKNWDLSSYNFHALDEGVFFTGNNHNAEIVGIGKNRIQRSQQRRRLQQERIHVPLQSQQYLHYHPHKDQFSTSTRLHLSKEDNEFINICRGYFGSYTPQTQDAC